MADIVIDDAIHGTNTARTMRMTVFTTTLIGYVFYIDSDSGYKYKKTTDGGFSWGTPVSIFTGTSIGSDCWFDQWTPGGTGTKVHCAYIGGNNVLYRSFDTANDSLGTETTIFTGASAVVGRGVFVSLAKARGGNMLCAFDIDAGAETGTYRSTDAGATWGVRTNLVEATIDQLLMFPGNETDAQDMWCLYHDASTDFLTLKMHDDSADTNTESAGLALVEQTSDGTGQYAFAGSIRHSDGHLIAVFENSPDVATSDLKVYDINGTGTLTALTDISTNIDDQYYPAIFIDQLTDDLYVSYGGKRDGSEVLLTNHKMYYTKSTDNGSTWTAGDTALSVGTLGRNNWPPLMGPKFMPVWRDPAFNTLLCNYSNSLTFSSDSLAPVGPLGSGTSKVNQTTVSLTTEIAIKANQLVIIHVGGDNEDATDGQTSLHTGVTVNGVAATKLGEYTNSQGAANAGATDSLWYYYNNTGSDIAAASTVVATHNVGKDAKCVEAVLLNVTLGVGESLVADGTAFVADDAADPSSITATGSYNVAHVWARGIAYETDNVTASTLTPTSGWSASSGTGTTGGVEASNISVRLEYKIATGTSSGASNPTGVAKDSASVLAGIAITAPPTSSPFFFSHYVLGRR